MTTTVVWARWAASFVLAGYVIGAPAAASATTIDFEGLSCQSSFANVGGFTFSSSWVTECDIDYAATWGNTTGAPSPTTAAGNSYAGAPVGVTISRSQPFNLVSGQASSFLVNDAFDFVTPTSSWNLLVEGYLNNVFVGSLTMNFDPGSGGLGAGYHALGSLSGIDELRFFSTYDQTLSQGPDYWLVDDLEFTDAVTAVPEPSALLLFGTGLSLVAIKFRSRRLLGKMPGRLRLFSKSCGGSPQTQPETRKN